MLNGINNAGLVVGESNYISNYLIQNGNRITLGVPLNLPFGEATAVNNGGQVVGRMYVGLPSQSWGAYLWQNGTLTGLGTLGGNSFANGINDAGQIVGSFQDGSRAAIWANGTMQDLNTLIPSDTGWVLQGAFAINNSGQIIGYGNKGGYLLTPVAVVPEPENYAMLLAGLALVGSVIRRRKQA